MKASRKTELWGRGNMSFLLHILLNGSDMYKGKSQSTTLVCKTGSSSAFIKIK
jgi:hypothetical protein